MKTQPNAVTRVMSFTSGKGGVGKTHTVINLGLSLAQLGKSVLIFDADLALANVDVMLGVGIHGTINDVLRGEASLEDIIVDGPQGISIIPASSGVEKICNLSSYDRTILLQEIERIAWRYDYLLIDTSAGVSSDVMYFNMASSEIVCVISGEPTSLTDAYALIKILGRDYGEREISILANNVTDEGEGLKAFRRLEKAVERFLHVHLSYLGFIPHDGVAREAIASQRALVEVFPSSRAAISFASLARKIDDEFHALKVKGGMQFFFKQLLEMGNNCG